MKNHKKAAMNIIMNMAMATAMSITADLMHGGLSARTLLMILLDDPRRYDSGEHTSLPSELEGISDSLRANNADYDIGGLRGGIGGKPHCRSPDIRQTQSGRAELNGGMDKHP